MYPILVDWGPLVLPAWHTMYVLGAIAAFYLFIRLAARHAPDIARSDLARLYAVCYVLGWFGARLLSIVVEEPETRSFGDVLAALVTFGPMTFYGGALAAFFGGALYIKLRRLPFATLVDLALPCGLVALALGRVGCFLNGDDYGKAVPLAPGEAPPFWAVTFPVLKDGIARYPVQLLEAGAVTLLVLVLLGSFAKLRTTLRPGVVAFLAIVGYANLRFALEFLRDDFRGNPFGNWLSTSQVISIAILIGCALTIPFWIRAGDFRGTQRSTSH